MFIRLKWLLIQYRIFDEEKMAEQIFNRFLHQVLYKTDEASKCYTYAKIGLAIVLNDIDD